MSRQFQNHYSTLGVNSSATADEIRRAYRILARRYHPDMNPGANAEERFKKIAEAYRILSDADRRRQFDIELESYQKTGGGAQTYTRSGTARRPNGSYNAQQSRESARERYQRFQKFQEEYSRAAMEGRQVRPPPRPPKAKPLVPKGAVSGLLRSLLPKGRGLKPAARGDTSPVGKVSIIEVSVTMRDAIYGIKKTVEISEPEGTRKISVRIPAGVRNGSVVRLRARGEPKEEIVLIVRVAAHPFMSIQQKGLVVEIPISVQEAIAGASITVPTLEDQVVLKVPPGTQSGQELRLKGKGIPSREGERGDLFIRLMVKVPESPEAVGIKERAAELESYYAANVRQALPKTLSEI